ncbi:MAG: AbrB/MazE/SpoVT family DNA-binding domain-containing protein [Pseudomonadota bacterium]
MIVEAKITSKGQVTIPKAVRKRLGVRAGDRLSFDMTGDTITIGPKPFDAEAFFAEIDARNYPSVTRPISDEEAIGEAIEERFHEREKAWLEKNG